MLNDRIAQAISDPAFLARFRARIRKTHGCWIWTSTRTVYGYGVIRYKGRSNSENGMLFAHRVAYALANGSAPQTCVCHTCDTPLCVNPVHLFCGTHADNMKDMVAKRRSARGERNGMAKISPNDVRSIRAARASGESVYELMSKYSLSEAHVRRIIDRQRWSHIS